MSRHNVDLSMIFSAGAYASLPEEQEIEETEVDSLAKETPKTVSIKREPYLPDKKLVDAVNLAIALGRPLLLQGDPGCGKTRLAYVVAYALKLPLEVSYIKSTSRASDLLYTYDAVNRLYNAELKGREASGNANSQSLSIDSYIRLGPLGRAIARAQYGRRSVVLIDEIDKADLDFPNDLLWELDRLEFHVAEAPHMRYAAGDRPELRPIVIVTHNEEKALPPAFLRRCIFHYVEFPSSEKDLLQILAVHDLDSNELNKEAIDLLLRLRKMDLNKNPGLSELLDWVGYLNAVNTSVEELDQLPHIGALLKQRIDQENAARKMAQQRPQKETLA